MVCTANDLSAWEDFPKGLRILLLEEDSNSAAELKSKLEAMDYIVSIFCNENEALSAISNEPESFHVAIVEVGTSNSNGRFEFLEAAKDLPAIMISNIHCLSIMMKCIALGAVEFLRKPLSEEKLRNIWQHVVRKAFNAGGNVQSESLKPVKDYVASMLQIKVETEEAKNESLERIENGSPAQENEHEQSSGSDKYPAPSTPQLKQGARLLDDGDCQDHTNCSAEKESEGESKSVENTCAMTEVTLQVNHPQSLSETLIKEEDDLADCVKCENNVSNSPQNKGNLNNPDGNAQTPDKASGLHNSYGTRVIRKKMKVKVDWTAELHKKFVQAVEQLGVDQAIPSRILEVMKVEGLTRHNVASHLQKYRMHRRHILPKEDDRRWSQQRSYYQHKPIMAYPPPHSNHTFQLSPVYPVWGAAAGQPPGVQMWCSSPGYSPWLPSESWYWKPYPGMHAEAWGCPVMPPPQSPYSSSPQNATVFHSDGIVDNGCNGPQNSFDLHPAEELVDNIVKEAINKPWLPLPLGLKPPSTDSVLAELTRQGISRLPSHINFSNSM
ncbi:two-component response regulator-like APRR2 isoform X3 [Manihot esculenta]|uniref:two-component response regulator-like APRR2 isoform X3 n=1 Tax=Manihot esculenta TaxID=3983 RepID=UPI001CC4A541|nr:two-component response regulator-like APRR2 isoform X3 [Manihot esculenta]